MICLIKKQDPLWCLKKKKTFKQNCTIAGWWSDLYCPIGYFIITEIKAALSQSDWKILF